MKKGRNRLTPFLIIILLILIWILIAIIAYKLINGKLKNIKRLKTDDDLVQELYLSVSDDELKIFSDGKYDISHLPGEYIITKASSYMTTEDVEFVDGSHNITISYESLDNAIKMALGPDIKYDLSNFKGIVDTYLELNNHRLQFDLQYDANLNSYIGTYQEIIDNDEIKIYRTLESATKTDMVNLKIGYSFYLENDKYQVCKDYTCKEIIAEVDSLDAIKVDNYTIVSFKKASDDVYYYYKNS